MPKARHQLWDKPTYATEPQKSSAIRGVRYVWKEGERIHGKQALTAGHPPSWTASQRWECWHREATGGVRHSRGRARPLARKQHGTPVSPPRPLSSWVTRTLAVTGPSSHPPPGWNMSQEEPQTLPAGCGNQRPSPSSRPPRVKPPGLRVPLWVQRLPQRFSSSHTTAKNCETDKCLKKISDIKGSNQNRKKGTQRNRLTLGVEEHFKR